MFLMHDQIKIFFRNLFHWYWIIALALVVLTAVSILALIYVPDAWFADRMMSERDRVYELLLISLACVALTAMLWATWVCTWMASRDEEPCGRHSPRTRADNMRLRAWAPMLCAIGFLLYSLVTFVFQPRVDPTVAPFAPVMYALSIGVAVGIVPLWLFIRWLGRSIIERYQVNMAARSICYYCGYDMRGNLSAEKCSECGNEVPKTPMLSEGASSATDSIPAT